MREVRLRYARAYNIHALGEYSEFNASVALPAGGSPLAAMFDLPFPRVPGAVTQEIEVWYQRPNRVRMAGAHWFAMSDGESAWIWNGVGPVKSLPLSQILLPPADVFFHSSLDQWFLPSLSVLLWCEERPPRIPRREFGVCVEEPPTRDAGGWWVRYESRSPRNPVLCEWLLDPTTLTVKQVRSRRPVGSPYEDIYWSGDIGAADLPALCSVLTWTKVEFEMPPPPNAFRFEGYVTLKVPVEAWQREPYLRRVEARARPEPWQRMEPADTGLEAPDLLATDINGRAVDLQDYRGRYTLVAFGRMADAESASQIIELQALRSKVAAEDLGIIGVVLDGPEVDVAALASAWGVTFPLVHEPERAKDLAEDWTVIDPPNLFLVNPEGLLVGIWPGLKTADTLQQILRDAGWRLGKQ